MSVFDIFTGKKDIGDSANFVGALDEGIGALQDSIMGMPAGIPIILSCSAPMPSSNAPTKLAESPMSFLPVKISKTLTTLYPRQNSRR